MRYSQPKTLSYIYIKFSSTFFQHKSTLVCWSYVEVTGMEFRNVNSSEIINMFITFEKCELMKKIEGLYFQN